MQHHQDLKSLKIKGSGWRGKLDMPYIQQLMPLSEICVDDEKLLQIKRQELVPLLDDHSRLQHYAARVVQAQSALLMSIDPKLTQDLSHSIQALIDALNGAKRYMQAKRFNRLQRWLGSDLDYASKQMAYYQQLERLIARTHDLSAQLQIEIQKSEARYQQLTGLREQMAEYIRAAQEFVLEYPTFVTSPHPLDQFSERLSKKINTLETLQSSNDIAMQQMYLSQQLALTLLDRFLEAEQVLLPAWKYHLQQRESTQGKQLTDLDRSRNRLIKTLKQALEHTTPSSSHSR